MCALVVLLKFCCNNLSIPFQKIVFVIIDKFEYELFKETHQVPYGISVDKLAEFQLKSDISFCYVIYNLKSGFVTY